MTKRIFTDEKKLNALKMHLDQTAVRSEAIDHFNHQKLLRQLNSPLSPKRTPWRLSLVAVAIVGLIISAGVYISQKVYNPSAPTILKASHPTIAQTTNAVKGFIPISSKSPLLNQNTPINVSATDGAKFLFAEQTTLWSSPNTELRLLSHQGDIFLNDGKLLAKYSKQKKKLTIKTAHGTIYILGTIFSVEATAQKLQIRLFEGRIEVVSPSQREIIPPGTYLLVENGRIVAKRPLDRADVISALLIAEKTYYLEGPKVPTLTLLPEISNIESSTPDAPTGRKKQRPRKSQKTTLLKANKNPILPKTSPPSFESPEPDEMLIEHSDSTPLVQQETPEAERILEDACTLMRNGKHQEGKEELKQYLKQHPKDRYWEHVNSILE